MSTSEKLLSNRTIRQIKNIGDEVFSFFAQGDDKEALARIVELLGILEQPDCVKLMTVQFGQSIIAETMTFMSNRDYVALSDSIKFKLIPWLENMGNKRMES